MENFNIYDFDKTIYDGDASVDFFLFCLKNKKVKLTPLIKILFNTILFLLKFKTQKEYKQIFFSFLKDIDNVENCVDMFWESKDKKIFNWYKKKDKKKDIIISASPEFLLKPICSKMNVYDLIATNMDKKSGTIYGENCYGKEKEIRLKKKYQDIKVDNFYSDSYSDQPLADIAKNSYLIVNGNIKNWEIKNESFFDKIKEFFFNIEFMKFLFVGFINVFNGVFFAMLFNILMGTNISFILGYIVALSISYLLNTKFIFYKKITIKKYIKFGMSYIPNFIVQNIVVFIMYNLLGISEFITFTTSAIVSVPITFFFIKEFAFGEKKKKKDNYEKK